MIRPRWRKVFSDLWGNLTRSTLVVASITVGLFAVGVIGTMSLVISRDMRAGFSAVNPTNVLVQTYALEPELIERIERLEGVRQAEGAYTFGLRLEASPGEWISIDLKAVPDYSEVAINRPLLQAGRWPGAKNEIAIDRFKLPKTHAGLGDWITLELPSGHTRRLQIVGIVHDETIGAAGLASGFFVAPVQGYLVDEALEWLEQPCTQNTLYATVEGDSDDLANIARVGERVRGAIEENDLPIYSLGTHSSFAHPNHTFTDALQGVLFVLGLLVMFLSGFLITNTLQALMLQQVQQIGIMKTVGAFRWQVTAIYMALIFIFGLLAFALAAPLAFAMAYRLLDFLAYQLNFTLQPPRLQPAVLLLQGAFALVMPQLAAFLPIWQGAQISVVEALSGYRQNQPPRRGWLDRQLSRFKRIPRPLFISFRNTFRRKGRLLLTLFTLSIGGAVFISTFNVRLSMVQFSQQIVQYFLADVNVTFARPYRLKEVEQVLSQVPGVTKVEGWAAARTELINPDGSVGERVQMLGVPTDSQLVKPVLISGRWLLPGDWQAVVLNDRFLSTFPDLQVGDSVRLRVNGDESTWVVVGFFQFAGKSGGYLAYTGYGSLAELTHTPGRAATFRIVSDRPEASTAEQKQLAERIEALLQARGFQVADVRPGNDLKDTATGGFNTLNIFFLFLALLTALVGSIGLAGTMSMNVLERTREIGVLRAIGASNPILMRMVLIEGLFIGLLSWAIGSLMAFPISDLLSDSVSLALFDTTSTLHLTGSGFAIWLGVVLLLSLLASVMPARSAARLTIREVLAYE
jgi:putative ABC transport system permease protein